jgi:hypothetical protein
MRCSGDAAGSGSVINYGSGSDFLNKLRFRFRWSKSNGSYGSGSGSTILATWPLPWACQGRSPCRCRRSSPWSAPPRSSAPCPSRARADTPEMEIIKDKNP